MKKLYILLLAAVLGLSFSSAAQDTETKYPVSITAPEGVIERITYGFTSYYPPFENLEFPANAFVKVILDKTNFGIDRVTVNGINYSSAASSFGQFSFYVESACEVVIEARDLNTATTDYTIYAENIEGIRLRTARLLTDQGESLDPGQGQAITTSLPTLGYGYEFDAANTRKYTVNVTDKYGKVWVSPAPGWYIQTVQVIEEDMFSIPGVIMQANASASYIIAKKYELDAEIIVNVIGNKYSFMSSRNPDYGMWQNPTERYSIHEGSQNIEFVQGMNLFNGVPSFEFGIRYATAHNVVYLNGEEAEKALDEDGNEVDGHYFVNYTPAEHTPIVTVYAGDDAPAFGTLEIKGEGEATLLSTPMAYSAEGPWTFLIEQLVEVQLSEAGATATFNGMTVAADEQGKLTLRLALGENTLNLGTSAADLIDAPEAQATYYNLQGMPVANPAAGGIYIRRQGPKVDKIAL